MSHSPDAGFQGPQIPENLDPYEIAYLRGSKNEVIRLIVARLLVLGYLREFPATVMGNNDPLLERNPEAPSLTLLDPAEIRCLEWFTVPSAVKSFFGTGGLLPRVGTNLQQYQKHLEEAGLLRVAAPNAEIVNLATKTGALALGLADAWYLISRSLHACGDGLCNSLELAGGRAFDKKWS